MQIVMDFHGFFFGFFFLGLMNDEMRNYSPKVWIKAQRMRGDEKIAIVLCLLGAAVVPLIVILKF